MLWFVLREAVVLVMIGLIVGVPITLALSRIPSSIPPINGKQKVEELYRTFFLQYREINHNAVVEEVQVAGDWAFLWGTDELRLLPDSGEPEVHMKGKGLSILKRQPDGEWKFWRGINNMTRQPTTP